MFPEQTPTPPSDPAPWQEYVPDTNKTAEENAAAKAAHDATKPAAPAPQAVPPPTAVAPDKLVLPEGFERDEAALGKFAEIMNAELSPQDRANQLIALQAEVMKGVSERANQAFIDTQQQWQQEVLSDPDIGGEKLDPALGEIAKLIDTYPHAAELREMFVVTGAGNHPHMIRFLLRLARERAEGKPTPGGTPTPAHKSTAERLYPSMQQG